MDTLSAALEIASQGFPVFPVRLCPDACLKCSVCKAPATPHGFHDASSDPDRIGSDQIREVSFDGARMILRPPPRQTAAGEEFRELTWERIAEE